MSFSAVGEVLAQKAQTVYAGCQLEKLPAGFFDWLEASEKLGLDLFGLRPIADTHAMQHTLKNHGIPAEARRGQKIILPSDFAFLPDILANPDSLAHLGTTKVGRLVVGFEKALHGWRFRAAMEIRTGRKELALVSFYTVGKTE